MRASSVFFVALSLVLTACEADVGIADKTEVGLGESPTDSDDPTAVGEQDVDGDGEDDDSEVTQEGPAPLLQVEPLFIDFGFQSEGTTVDSDVIVTNLGDAPLVLDDLGLVGPSSFGTAASGTIEIAPGASAVLTVAYTAALRLDEGSLDFVSNDTTFPAISVGLEGTGANPALQSQDLVFGIVSPGTTVTQDLPLYNPGNVAVTVSDVQSSDPAFDVGPITSPVVVEPGQTSSVEVHFTPDDYLQYSGVLSFTSDARVEAPDVNATGQGGDNPVAICATNPGVVTAITQSFDLLGFASYDPGGSPLTARWRWVSRPTGSTTGMPGGTRLDRGPITPDVVGDYTAELVVTNQSGLESEPCVTTVRAEPDADLWVELSWQHPNDDMDLHFLRGTDTLNSSNDCYYQTCVGGGPRWGAGTRRDDPYLDLDDIPATGPENANIEQPVPGIYRVVIHDYPGRRRTAANDVTVRIFVEGVLAFEETRTITGEDSYTAFARIDYRFNGPDVVIISL